jgi:hypothetical protein
MLTSGRVVRGDARSKVVFGGLAAVFSLFAPPTVKSAAAEEVYDFQVCHGYFALCPASTCTPTGGLITVRTATGGTARFPAADCTCPVIYGPSIANLAGGNMQGSCTPPADHIWSTYQPRSNIPQALTNWVPTPPEAAAPPLFCPKSLGFGSGLVNCFSFLCESEHYINNVPVVTCHCPVGESLAGTPVAPRTAFLTQAGRGDQAYCGPGTHPVSGPIEFPQLRSAGRAAHVDEPETGPPRTMIRPTSRLDDKADVTASRGYDQHSDNLGLAAERVVDHHDQAARSIAAMWIRLS